ncbi:MAG: hypothetical protein ACI85U_003029, partial [Candidatus Promineifilaceae bacterium]
TYVWQVTGQLFITSVGGLGDTQSFKWNSPGVKTIKVIAQNEGGTATQTYLVTVDRRKIFLPLILR